MANETSILQVMHVEGSKDSTFNMIEIAWRNHHQNYLSNLDPRSIPDSDIIAGDHFRWHQIHHGEIMMSKL